VTPPPETPAPIPIPIPGAAPATVAVPPPGDGPGCWSGAPSAARDTDGAIWLAYRRRLPEDRGRGAATVLARSDDGERFTTVLELGKDRFGAASLERPALVQAPDGSWRLYVSCATPHSKHWRIDVLEAATPDALDGARARTVLPGDRHWGVKDPVIRQDGSRWNAWICCHPLDEPGEEDRMRTRFATSDDGLTWTWHGDALTGRPGAWDARGARVTAVLPEAGVAYYDGRATAAENFHERTGVARGDRTLARLRADDGHPPAASPDGDGALRYLDVLALPGGTMRLFYERSRADGAHELCTGLAG
jgi:hypothetical protein